MRGRAGGRRKEGRREGGKEGRREGGKEGEENVAHLDMSA